MTESVKQEMTRTLADVVKQSVRLYAALVETGASMEEADTAANVALQAAIKSGIAECDGDAVLGGKAAARKLSNVRMELEVK